MSERQPQMPRRDYVAAGHLASAQDAPIRIGSGVSYRGSDITLPTTKDAADAEETE